MSMKDTFPSINFSRPPWSLLSSKTKTLTLTTNNSGWWRPYHDLPSNLPVTLGATIYTFLPDTRTVNSFLDHFSPGVATALVRSHNILLIVLHVMLVFVILSQCSPLSFVEECRDFALIGREDHSDATLLAGSLWHKG